MICFDESGGFQRLLPPYSAIWQFFDQAVDDLPGPQEAGIPGSAEGEAEAEAEADGVPRVPPNHSKVIKSGSTYNKSLMTIDDY